MEETLRAAWGSLGRVLLSIFGIAFLLLGVVLFFGTPGVQGTTPVCLIPALWCLKRGWPSLYAWLVQRLSTLMEWAKKIPYLGKVIIWTEKKLLAIRSWVSKQLFRKKHPAAAE